VNRSASFRIVSSPYSEHTTERKMTDKLP